MNGDRNDESTPDDTECLPPCDDQSSRQWLTDECRYSIVMTVLGHPKRLPSLAELDYYVDAKRSAICTELDALVDRKLLRSYEFSGEPRHADDPLEFWGPTESGVRWFHAWGYRQYVPIVEALQEATVRSQTIQRHREARRPAVPEPVRTAFAPPPVDDTAHSPGEEGGWSQSPDIEGSPSGARTGGFDAQRVVQVATDERRAAIVADIVGHPQGLPSVEELTYMSPTLDERAVRDQLEALQDAGVVRAFDLDERLRGYPSTFYGLTDDVRAAFDDWGLFSEGPWQRQYQRVAKTPRIRALETMPRPDP